MRKLSIYFLWPIKIELADVYSVLKFFQSKDNLSQLVLKENYKTGIIINWRNWGLFPLRYEKNIIPPILKDGLKGGWLISFGQFGIRWSDW